jgi:hypothetical protein
MKNNMNATALMGRRMPQPMLMPASVQLRAKAMMEMVRNVLDVLVITQTGVSLPAFGVGDRATQVLQFLFHQKAGNSR